MIPKHLPHCLALALGTALLGPAPLSAQGALDEYVFATPRGWTGTRYPDGIVLAAPVANTGERCLISLWPTRPAGPNLLNDADNAFQEIFKTYQRSDQTTRGTAMPPIVVRGISGQGWDYVIVKKGIRKAPGPGVTYQTLLGFVFAAKLGNHIAVISGMSKDPLVSTCFGELAGNVWPEFFYSLGFKTWTPTPSPVLAKALVGTWTTASATAADQFAFAANGRYGGASAVANYNRISSGEVVQTTQAFAGDGAYTLEGNKMVLTPDNHARSPENALFRVEDENTGGDARWLPVLYMLRKSVVDGSLYEVRYKKQ